jgi:hypothetical protein
MRNLAVEPSARELEPALGVDDADGGAAAATLGPDEARQAFGVQVDHGIGAHHLAPGRVVLRPELRVGTAFDVNARTSVLIGR